MMNVSKKKILKATVGVVITIILMLQLTPAGATDQGQPGTIRNHVQTYSLIQPGLKGSTGDNILVSNAPGDDIIPGITRDASGHTVVTWTNEPDQAIWNMAIAYSSIPTNPASWTGYIITLANTTAVYSSDTCYVNGPEGLYQGLYGVQLFFEGGYNGYYMIPDITTDPSTWIFYYFNDPVDMPTYATVEDQGFYYEPYHSCHGPVNMFIYHEVVAQWDIPDCPMYTIYDFANLTSMTYFDAQSHLWTAPAKDPAMAMLPNEFHLAWQYHNATTYQDQIVWKKINSSVDADIEFTPFQQYVANGTNPEIAAFQQGTATHVAVVYVNGNNVNCVYSNDDGTTWSTPVSLTAGSYPALCAVGTKFYCAYIDQGNLFLKTSNDGGATWGAAEQINDQPGTVSAEENAVDIHAAGIVWIDTRGADKDIYYAALPGGTNNPPSAPTITGPVNGKKGTPYPYVFTSTDPEADDVYYFIDWGDHSNTSWIGPYSSGTAITQFHTWTTRGTYTIKAKAKDSYGNESDWGTLQITMPLSYEPPQFRFLYWLFERFPHTFPLLRYLLGY